MRIRTNTLLMQGGFVLAASLFLMLMALPVASAPDQSPEPTPTFDFGFGTYSDPTKVRGGGERIAIRTPLKTYEYVSDDCPPQLIPPGGQTHFDCDFGTIYNYMEFEDCFHGPDGDWWVIVEYYIQYSDDGGDTWDTLFDYEVPSAGECASCTYLCYWSQFNVSESVACEYLECANYAWRVRVGIRDVEGGSDEIWANSPNFYFVGECPACDVSPSTLSFDVDHIGQSQSRTFTITNTGGGTLSGSISEGCPEFSVSPSSYSLASNQSQTITVTYTPQDCGDDTCNLNLTSPCNDVFCNATGPDEPQCVLSTNTLSFDVSQIGQSQTQTFTVTNAGCGVLSGSISESSPEFSVSPMSYNLGEEQSSTISVTYTPQDCGNDNCSLSLSLPCSGVTCNANGPDEPECQISPTTLTFVVAEIGQSQSRTLTFCNPGCGDWSGCISLPCPELSVVPACFNLGPGQCITLTITYTPQNCGDDNCTMTLPPPCNDVIISIALTGPSEPDCSVSPTSLTFDVPTIGGSQSKTFSITNIGCGTLNGTVSEPCSEFSVSSPSYNLGPNQPKTFTVTYSPNDCGNDNCTIETGNGLCSDVSCSATGPICGCVVTPTSLSFDVGATGEGDSQTFTISNEGGTALSGSISESCPEFLVDPTDYSIPPGGATVFTVTYTPVDCGNDDCTIETGNDLCADVDCSATGPSTPVCSVGPQTLDFGSVHVDATGTLPFTVTNTGCGTLSGSISVTCPEFDVSPSSYTLEPDESSTFTVEFDPPTTGEFSCTIVVDGTECQDVNCTGVGIDCPLDCNFTVTGSSYSILITSATLDGDPIEPGDKICVYDGDLCVGGVEWTGETPLGCAAWADDPQTDPIDGYVCGNPISFGMIDVDPCVEYSTCDIVFSVGDGSFCDGAYASVAIDFCSHVTQCCELHGNWNWVSFHVDPEGDCDAPPVVFADCDDGINIAQARNGDFWIPGVYDGIGCMDYCTGMLKVHFQEEAAPCVICVTGQLCDLSTPIPMAAGWNWIGYLPLDCYAPEATLGSIWDNLVIIQNEGGDFCIPDLYCGIAEMCPCEGFTAYMSDPGTLVYEIPSSPLATARPDVSPRIPSRHYVSTDRTGDFQAVLIEDVAVEDLSLEIGDEIGVFVRKLCVGAAVWDGNMPLGLTAWADDPQTDRKDGYLPGELLQIRVWDQSERREIPVQAEYTTGSAMLGQHPVIVTRLTSALALKAPKTPGGVGEDGIGIPLQYSIQHQPNPARIGTMFRLGLPEPASVTLDIYTTSGRLVRLLMDRKVSAGFHQVEWDGRDESGRVVADGVYFYRFVSPNHDETRSMVFLR
ncbi:choice-of-anchor D domain-containing protein [Candidatus Eisenbacteria bacterium]|uniref:Choice-of-anchor D domain-containing protein n=1 Tax=Eiseniibacteriota bacterium TaxID=2212470 RepID=A0ABV6YLQ8_UNCEI